MVLFVCNWSAWSICCSLCGVHVEGGKYSCWSGAADDSHNYRLGCPTAERKRERVCVSANRGAHGNQLSGSAGPEI